MSENDVIDPLQSILAYFCGVVNFTIPIPDDRQPTLADQAIPNWNPKTQDHCTPEVTRISASVRQGDSSRETNEEETLMSFHTENIMTAQSSLRDVPLMDQALAELQSLPYGPLRQVNCRVENNIAVLSGRVSTFYQKQLAQERLRQCLGAGIQICNDLQVQCKDVFPVV